MSRRPRCSEPCHMMPGTDVEAAAEQALFAACARAVAGVVRASAAATMAARRDALRRAPACVTSFTRTYSVTLVIAHCGMAPLSRDGCRSPRPLPFDLRSEERRVGKEG